MWFFLFLVILLIGIQIRVCDFIYTFSTGQFIVFLTRVTTDNGVIICKYRMSK